MCICLCVLCADFINCVICVSILFLFEIITATNIKMVGLDGAVVVFETAVLEVSSSIPGSDQIFANMCFEIWVFFCVICNVFTKKYIYRALITQVLPNLALDDVVC